MLGKRIQLRTNNGQVYASWRGKQSLVPIQPQRLAKNGFALFRTEITPHSYGNVQTYSSPLPIYLCLIDLAKLDPILYVNQDRRCGWNSPESSKKDVRQIINETGYNKKTVAITDGFSGLFYGLGFWAKQDGILFSYHQEQISGPQYALISDSTGLTITRMAEPAQLGPVHYAASGPLIIKNGRVVDLLTIDDWTGRPLVTDLSHDWRHLLRFNGHKWDSPIASFFYSLCTKEIGRGNNRQENACPGVTNGGKKLAGHKINDLLGQIPAKDRLTARQYIRLTAQPTEYLPGFYTLKTMRDAQPTEFHAITEWVSKVVIPSEVAGLLSAATLTGPITAEMIALTNTMINAPIFQNMTLLQFLNATHLLITKHLTDRSLTSQAKISSYRREINPLVLPLIEQIMEHPFTFEQALIFSICGNYFDPNTPDFIRGFEAEGAGYFRSLYQETLSRHLAQPDSIDAAILKDRISKAKSIAYLLDNQGEIFFDLVFISAIVSLSPEIKIRIIPKSGNASEDANYDDLLAALALPLFKSLAKNPNITLAADGPNMKGIDLRNISQGLAETILNADLVVRKGMANWESLQGLQKDSFSLLVVKGLSAQNTTGYSKNTPNNRKYLLCAYLPAGIVIGRDYCQARDWQLAANTGERIFCPVNNLSNYRNQREQFK